MFLPALVLDNNNFQFTGKIRVRIQKYCTAPISWDMAEDATMISKGIDPNTGNSGDFDVYVMSPFGVGKNCSLFFLPRVNSKGVVTPLGTPDSREFVWVGGYFDEVSDSNGNSNITVPGQDERTEDYGINNGSWIGNKNAFVFRTKTTSMAADYNDLSITGTDGNTARENIDFNAKETENLIIIEDSGIKIRHFTEFDKDRVCVIYEDIFIGTNPTTIDNPDGTISTTNEAIVKLVSVNNKESGKETSSIFTLKDTETTLEFQSADSNNPVNNTIKINSKAINMISIMKEKTSYYTQKGENITINVEDTAIVIDKDIISLSAKQKVMLSAPEVRLGGENQRIVTTSSLIKSYELPGGVIISSSSKAFA